MSGKFVYKNVSENPQTLIGFGIVEPGETIETETMFDNPNFVLQTESSKKVGVVPVTKPKENK